MTSHPTSRTHARVVVTGATGRVARPIVEALAGDCEIWALARFTDETVRQQFERLGIHCVPVDLDDPDFRGVPEDADHVLNFAADMSRAGDFDQRLRTNAEAGGLLMAHCCRAKAFLHCSTTAVYARGAEAHHETSALGDDLAQVLPMYSITKIAAEAVVRCGARMFGVPTVIARLNVPYGEWGGWPAAHLEAVLAGRPVPVPRGGDAGYSPIHTSDMIASLPHLLAAATVPATIVNWAGSEVVTIQQWTQFFGELVGRPVSFVETDQTLPPVVADTKLLESIAGPSSVPWRTGMRAMADSLLRESERRLTR